MDIVLSLSTFDWAIVSLYFAAIFLLVFKLNKSTKLEKSQDYFLAGRNLGWFLVGASLFASNIGSEHLIGLAATGAKSGVAVGQFEVLACFMLLFLGWMFVPFYIRSNVHTMPEFLEKRFSPAARNYLTYVSIIAYVLTKISVTIYAGGIVFESIGVPFWTGALIIVSVTGVYTVVGGLRAVIYTDALQMVVMLGGAILLTLLGLQHIGGPSALTSSLDQSFFNMWLPMDHPDFPWTGILFGAPILGIWYWCTDQYVVQRTLSAANITQARRGSIFAGFLKLLPVLIFVGPGLIMAVILQRGELTINSDQYDLTLPLLASFIVPSGLKGLFIAGLLAALMSSLSSVFNSCSTLITYDFIKVKYPDLSEQKLIHYGKLSTVGLVIIGIAWIPFMHLISNEMYVYIQSVQAYISPPIAAVFLLGLAWKKVNGNGASCALYSGLVIGMLRFICEVYKKDINENNFLYAFTHMNFLHFACMLFVISAIIMIVVSILKPSSKNIDGLTINWTKCMTLSDKKLDLITSAILVGCVFITWWVFS